MRLGHWVLSISFHSSFSLVDFYDTFIRSGSLVTHPISLENPLVSRANSTVPSPRLPQSPAMMVAALLLSASDCTVRIRGKASASMKNTSFSSRESADLRRANVTTYLFAWAGSTSLGGSGLRRQLLIVPHTTTTGSERGTWHEGILAPSVALAVLPTITAFIGDTRH